MAFISTVKQAYKAKIYNNGGTHASPTWDEIDIVRDCTLSMEQNENDITARNGLGYVQTAGTLIDASVEFGVVWDTGNAAFSALLTAFFDRAPVELRVLDNDQTDPETGVGLQAFFVVTSFTRNEGIADVLTADLTLKLTKNPREGGEEITDVPAWVSA